MFLSGTLLNAATVLVGGLMGTFLGDRLPRRIREALVRATGLFSLALGAKFAIDTTNLLYPLGAILIGGAVGAALSLDQRLTDFGDRLERRFAERAEAARAASVSTPFAAVVREQRGEDLSQRALAAEPARTSTVSEAFVTSTIVFCVGPLTFLGAIQNGLTGDATLLAIKSVLDGFTAIALAATLGWGVLLTIAVILVYQGGLAAGAVFFSGLLSETQTTEMTAAGGLMIIGVGLRLLDIRDVKVADFLPAILVAPIIVALSVTLRPLLPF